MANDDPFGILLAPPDDPNRYPHIRGDDRYFKTYDPFGNAGVEHVAAGGGAAKLAGARKADYDCCHQRLG